MIELLQQIIVIVANSGVAVLITNLLKNFFPSMDGNSDKVASAIAVIGFVAAWFVKDWYSPDLLINILPVIDARLTEIVQVITGIITLLTTLGLLEPIYALIRKLKIAWVSKSFSEK